MQEAFVYKFLILFVTFLVVFGFSFVASASIVIFSDGFESDFSNWTGNDPKWDTSGGNIHGGSKRGEAKGNTEPGDDVLLKNISTSSYGGIALEFWYRIKESLEDDDHVYVEWTADGSRWNILNDFTAVTKFDTWAFASSSLPVEADDKSNFAIRFRAHLGAVTSDIFYLDDVVVSAGSTNNTSTLTPTPEISSTPVPSVLPKPSSEAEKPTLISSATPMQPSPTPPLTSISTSTPTPSLVTLKPSVSSTPTFSSSPKSEKQESVEIRSATPSEEPLVKTNDDSANLSNSSELRLEEEAIVLETPDSLPASISNFFNGTKFFWLIGTMVLSVVFSLAKLKKD